MHTSGFPVTFVTSNVKVMNVWIPYIAKEGRCKLINVSLQDNMENFRDGNWTEHGLRVNENLKRTLTGAQYRRLRLGEWCNQAGAVFPEFDEKNSRHRYPTHRPLYKPRLDVDKRNRLRT